MSRVLVGSVCAIAAVSLSACGTSAPSAADTATASFKAELLQQSISAASPFMFTPAQAQCAASRVVSAVGTPALQRYGLLDAQNKATTKTLDSTTLTAQDATSVVNAIIDCLGSANFTKALTTAIDKTIKGTQTAAQRACLESKLTAARLKPMLIATLSGNQGAAQVFAQGVIACTSSKK